MARYKVVIIQRRLTHYRKPFFVQLKNKLSEKDIELVLIHGKPSAAELTKKDNVRLPWAKEIENRPVKLFGKTLLWQGCLPHLKNADLIIVEQASKLVLNYILLLYQTFGKYKICFWGHGRSFQLHHVSHIGEKIKAWVSKQAYWWFAYNDLSASAVKDLGYTPERITSVQNAIDTLPLQKALKEISEEEAESLKKDEGIKSNHICIYTSSLYEEKRVAFLLEACQLIRKEIKDFEIIIIGAGPKEDIVKSEALDKPWIHYKGALFDTEKVPYFKISKLMLLPGLVGLSIIDAFALETPIITTDVPYHSPEIDYLIPGNNGMIISPADDALLYAKAVVELLRNEKERMHLVEGCKMARQVYTLDNMSSRFSEGIQQALIS